MSGPRLTRALLLEAPVSTPDGAGGVTTTWQLLGTHWAEIRAGQARARPGALGTTADVRLRITLRAAPAGNDRRPRPGQRFREGQRVFQILAVTEADAEGRWLVVTAREEEAA